MCEATVLVLFLTLSLAREIFSFVPACGSVDLCCTKISSITRKSINCSVNEVIMESALITEINYSSVNFSPFNQLPGWASTA